MTAVKKKTNKKKQKKKHQDIPTFINRIYIFETGQLESYSCLSFIRDGVKILAQKTWKIVNVIGI